MTACEACTQAEHNPRSELWSNDCNGCKARALVLIGGHRESKEAGRMTAGYRETLERLFGAEWKEGAAAVKRWAKLTDQQRKGK